MHFAARCLAKMERGGVQGVAFEVGCATGQIKEAALGDHGSALKVEAGLGEAGEDKLVVSSGQRCNCCEA